MSEIIKIALLGIAGVLFAIQFRQQRPEYTLLIGFALSVAWYFPMCWGLTGRLAGGVCGITAVPRGCKRVSRYFDESGGDHLPV